MVSIACAYKLKFYVKREGDFFQATVDIMIWLSPFFYKKYVTIKNRKNYDIPISLPFYLVRYHIT
ncbi:hypothetical protein SAMN04488168_110117 [Bacillus sp. 491mf]|nr:hypothetical protein SAMN04488168_110117 [Bacillus sp. 491mf]